MTHCADGDASRELAAFEEHRKLSILDVIHIENQADLLGYSAPLIEEGTLKPRVKKSVEAEAVRAF